MPCWREIDFPTKWRCHSGLRQSSPASSCRVTGRQRLPDPLLGLVHAATAEQTCRFYYLLARGRLVTPEHSRQMLDALVDPGVAHKFVKALGALAPEATIFRKSGTWCEWHADSVLVFLHGFLSDSRFSASRSGKS